MDEWVIAVDPGREKCGLAVVQGGQGVMIKQVVDTQCLLDKVEEQLQNYPAIQTLVLGDRTSSRQAQIVLQAVCERRTVKLVLVDEHRSTDVARKRYWQENPPHGFKRLIPVTMQVPPVPVDDYVAVILAERYFAGDVNTKYSKDTKGNEKKNI